MTEKNLSHSILRNVNLDQESYRIIWKVAKDKGLGSKGFSAALRLIVREYGKSYFRNEHKSNGS